MTATNFNNATWEITIFPESPSEADLLRVAALRTDYSRMNYPPTEPRGFVFRLDHLIRAVASKG